MIERPEHLITRTGYKQLPIITSNSLQVATSASHVLQCSSHCYEIPCLYIDCHSEDSRDSGSHPKPCHPSSPPRSPRPRPRHVGSLAEYPGGSLRNRPSTRPPSVPPRRCSTHPVSASLRGERKADWVTDRLMCNTVRGCLEPLEPSGQVTN